MCTPRPIENPTPPPLPPVSTPLLIGGMDQKAQRKKGIKGLQVPLNPISAGLGVPQIK